MRMRVSVISTLLVAAAGRTGFATRASAEPGVALEGECDTATFQRFVPVYRQFGAVHNGRSNSESEGASRTSPATAQAAIPPVMSIPRRSDK